MSTLVPDLLEVTFRRGNDCPDPHVGNKLLLDPPPRDNLDLETFHDVTKNNLVLAVSFGDIINLGPNFV